MSGVKKFSVIAVCVLILSESAFAKEVEIIRPEHVELPSVVSGKVEYARRNPIAFESAGLLTYVARPGLELPGSVFNADGGMVSPGGVLAKQDQIVQRSDFTAAKARLREAEFALTEKKENFERDSKLASKNAVSMRKFLESRIAYERAVWNLEAARAELDRAQRLVDGRIQAATFPCLVESVSLSGGTVADVAQQVMSIVLVEAMKIVVELPDYATRLIDQTTPIRVYPAGAEQPVAAWFEMLDVGTESLTCYVDNPQVPLPKGMNPTGMPEVRDVTFLFPPMPSTGRLAPFWVISGAVMYNGDQSFLWKIENEKALEPKHALAREFVLRKIPVRRENLFFNQGIYRLEGITPLGETGLKPFDLVATKVAGAATDGKTAFYRAEKRLFRDGERVAVQILFSPDAKFWKLPRKVLNCGDSGFFVLVRNGVADTRRVAVKIGNLTRDNAIVCGDKLSADLEIIVPSSGD